MAEDEAGAGLGDSETEGLGVMVTSTEGATLFGLEIWLRSQTNQAANTTTIKITIKKVIFLDISHLSPAELL